MTGRQALASALVAGLAVGFAVAAPAHAQAPDGSRLEGAAGVALPIGAGFGPAWRGGVGGLGTLAAPLLGGTARASLAAVPFENADPDVPDFLLLVPTVGWGRPVLIGPVRWTVGGEVGIAQFRFGDDDAFGGNLTNETEVTTGLWLRADLGLAGPVRLWAEARAHRIALADAVVVPSGSAGVALDVVAPAWVRAAFR